MKAKEIKNLKEHYLKQSQSERQIWVECYKNYICYSDQLQNPYLSNLSIPKVHEAVELLSAFLIGRNQTIDATPQSGEDVVSARYMNKLLDFQWAKILDARRKLIIWCKQGILFGNGIMKVGWDVDKDQPYMNPLGLDTVFMDYYQPDIQKTPVIHRIVRPIKEVRKDGRYKNTQSLISISESDIEESDTKFSNYDNTQTSGDMDDKTELLEMFDPYEMTITTVAPTRFGWKHVRKIDNPFKDADGEPYLPFVKLRFKNSPLPNRAYDMGAIEPTLDIQKSFNMFVNQFADNTSMINDKMWVKRRSANIDPKSMQRRPGGIIEVNDINADIRTEETSDIKASLFEMIRFLDEEFQQASLVINLLKGIGDSNTATEASIGQQNVQTMLDMIDGNIKDGMSGIGQMLVDLNLQYMDKKATVKLFENDKEIGFADIKPKDIKGKYDVNISADRAPAEGKAVRQKQILDFISIVAQDPITLQKYPELLSKLYRRWLNESGIDDIEDLFEENKEDEIDMGGMMQGMQGGGMMQGGGERQFNPATGNTPQAMEGMAQSPNITQPNKY